MTVIGGGHGLAAVLTALRHEPCELTVVVTIADDGGSSGELRRRLGGPAVGDLRRALIALAEDHSPLVRAFARPVAVEGFGRHPLGNLVLRSLAEVFGDLTQATEWLGRELGIRARVLPATVDNVTLVAEVGGVVIVGESAIGSSQTTIRRLRFSPERPRVNNAALDAIATSDHILLAPGSLFTSVLAACALPDVVRALAETAARKVWICNPGRATAPRHLRGRSAVRPRGRRLVRAPAACPTSRRGDSAPVARRPAGNSRPGAVAYGIARDPRGQSSSRRSGLVESNARRYQQTCRLTPKSSVLRIDIKPRALA
ncbi:MAG: YvcK family protein [Solirubrobacterales bacterium]|nr:YvcK family protein [Solirubrobacterales bacterium]